MRAHSRARVFIYVFCSCFVRTALQQRTRLARWGCRRSSSSQKVTNFLGALFDWVPLRLSSHEKDNA